MFSTIKTMPQLREAIVSTYLYDLLIAVIFIVLLIIIANAIPWYGGKIETSGKTRRSWFFVLAFVTILACVGFNFFAFYNEIGVASFKTTYMMHMIAGGFVGVAVYSIVLIIIISMQKTKSKLESIKWWGRK